MPPRNDLGEYEQFLDFNGQRLRLDHIETTMTDREFPERTYTFTGINPVNFNTVGDITIPNINLDLPELTFDVDGTVNQAFNDAIQRHLGQVGDIGDRGDIDGDENLEETRAGTYTVRAEDVLHHANVNTTISDRLSWNFNLTDEFKEVLKPFIQEVVKEMLENEGFILGKLPGEE